MAHRQLRQAAVVDAGDRKPGVEVGAVVLGVCDADSEGGGHLCQRDSSASVRTSSASSLSAYATSAATASDR
jgi:hypothetical protein